MRVDDRDAVLTTFTSFRPELVLHGGALTAVDRCETEVDLAFAVNAVGTRHSPRRPPWSGRTWSTCRPTTSSTAPSARPYREWDAPCPTLGLRRLQAGGRAGVPARVHHRAHELAVRCPRRQHGGHRPAPGRRRRRAALRRRPARVADLHGRPGARHRHARASTAGPDLPRHQQRRDDLVGLRAGGAGRGRRRPRAGAARSPPPSSTRPVPAPRPAYSVLDNMALRLSGLPGPARLAGRPGPARPGAPGATADAA